MPSEVPRYQPRETHQRLLDQQGNTHLSLLSNEIAWMPNNNSRRIRDTKMFISGTIVGIVAIVGSLMLMIAR
jgi:hypothetical protein